ncbi:MAG: hypothetical protein LW710_02180 [Burkholderiales bacterium]|uniref:hypothetical protein n=1 Tax=Limnobacter sp. TaxID=2003368 RepID=UPI00394B372C|nr:hypothetical protein [Burkholderiales bacterium]
MSRSISGYVRTRSETASEAALHQRFNRESLVNVLVAPAVQGTVDGSNLVAHSLANCNVQLAWQLVEAHEDASALSLVQGEARPLEAFYNLLSDEEFDTYNEIRSHSSY